MEVVVAFIVGLVLGNLAMFIVGIWLAGTSYQRGKSDGFAIGRFTNRPFNKHTESQDGY